MKTRQLMLGAMLTGLSTLSLGEILTTDDVVSRLRSEDQKVREKAAQEILVERQGLINDIENIVREFKDDYTRSPTLKTSIELLGKLRSDESIPLLIDHLLTVLYDKGLRPNSNRLHPCVGALIDIGHKAIEPLFASVETTENELFAFDAAYAMIKIMGLNVALHFLEKRWEGQTDSDLRERFRVLKWRMNQWAESMGLDK